MHIAIRLGNLSIARMIVTAGGMELLKLKNKAEKTPDQETSDKKFLELIFIGLTNTHIIRLTGKPCLKTRSNTIANVFTNTHYR